MAPARKGRKLKKPRFPRKQWVAGQAPRIEKPKKGRGAYDRGRVKRDELDEEGLA